MKQMSRAEIQSFLEFGPSYFEYLTKTLSDKQAQVSSTSCLADIFHLIQWYFLVFSWSSADFIIVEKIPVHIHSILIKTVFVCHLVR